MTKLQQFLIPLAIFFLALFYRGYKAWLHHPFWVDEFSTAFQANLMREYGTNLFAQNNFYVEYHNFLPHFFVATSFELLGQTTFAARLPFILIGSLVPLLIWYLLDRVLKQKEAALAASALSLFSYLEITWSRQARGYVLQQILFLTVLIAYFSLGSTKTKRQYVFWLTTLAVTAVLGVMTHMSFILVLGVIVLHALWFNRKGLLQKLRANRFLLAASTIAGVAIFGLAISPVSRFIQFLLAGSFPNNLGYYHSFLWREYGLIVFLSLVGAIYGWMKHRKETALFILAVIIYLLFFSFIFEPRVSRYLLPVFPIFFMTAGLGLKIVADSLLTLMKSSTFKTRLAPFLTLFFAMAIIVNGDKFVVKPKMFYSVNHDFREIALIDYDQVYNVIKEKGQLDQNQTAVVDTWSDRRDWYLGQEFPARYTLRWTDSTELLKQTPYELTENGEKLFPLRKGEKIVSNLDDLMLVMQKYPRGFIWIDDSSLPADVRTFAEENLKKELFLDHYTFDDNPYSLWPGTLYSWGVDQ